MDYKNLIKKLEYQAETIRNNNCTTMSAEESEAAANAIKTLLAERDALIEQVHGRCLFCANRIKCLCENDIEFRSYCRLNNDCNWQWRGPQKHD